MILLAYMGNRNNFDREAFVRALAGLVGAWLACGAARAEDAGGAAASALLPEDLSLSGMYLSADPLVKAVMIGLALASFVTWTVTLAKSLEILFSGAKLGRQVRRLEKCDALGEAIAALSRRGGLEAAALDAQGEIDASARLETSGAKERIASRLERREAQFARRLGRATGWLATIGATAPFVGLFGTVWGVMNAFIGISKHHTTNLAVIAPGLAEALLTTALGLAAAIPAVVFYNALARAIAGARARYADGSAAILRAAGRDLDRAALPRAARSAAAE